MVKENHIDVEPEHLKLIKKILKRHITYKTVWAYGSRVDWTANQYSDLDLVVFDANTVKLGELKDNFAESDLPFSVDVILWERIPGKFKTKILEKYVVLQKKPELDNWKEGILGDVAEVIMGQSPKGELCNTNGNGKPLLNGPTEFGVKNPHPFQFTEDPKKLCKKNDILFCVRGSTTGRMNWADQQYAIGRGIAALRHKEGDGYNHFIRGIIDFNLLGLLASATGSTFPNVSRNQLEDLAILIPPLPEQETIASILSSLDDKINLLRCQNKILEAMAETLFRQWFVEEARDDWEEGKLDSLINISSGKGLKKDLLIENGIYPVLGANGEIGRTNEFLFDEKLLFTGRVGTLGNIFRVENEKVWLSDNTLAIKPKNHFNFIYFVLKAAKLEEYNVGSTQPLIRQSDIKEIAISLPSETKLHEFEKKSDLLFQKMKQNITQIHTLEKLRNTLLPKLMSGEIRIGF